jgi:hypothetical protein
MLKVLVIAAAAALAVAAVAAAGKRDPHAGHVLQQHKVGAADANAAALARARLATARFATDLAAAKKAGWSLQITPNMPGMGFHFLNPNVKGFDVTKPAILVYVRRGNAWQLGAFEWVWPEKPAKTLPGATYGSFAAACHYVNGVFVPAAAETDCAATNQGAKLAFWHPDLVTLHVWLWYPNPDGIFKPTNTLVTPFTPKEG